MNEMTEQINNICPENLYEVGYASLEGFTDPRFSSYPYALSLARKLDDSIIDRLSSGPTLEYLHHYAAINDELHDKIIQISRMLKEYGIDAFPVKPTLKNSELDRSSLRYSISHKMAATCSGLGWIGKSDLLVTKRFGPRVRLATVLTSKPPAACGEPIRESLCGQCMVCVKACPAKAATGQSWTLGIDRDEYYNAFTCMDYCQYISRKNLQQDAAICGICVTVCPRGKKDGKN